MTFPAQIVLPSGNEIYRAGHPRPAQPVRGSIIIGRVLAPLGGEQLTTPDGVPAVRVQFPIGTVLVPVEGSVEAGVQVYAQVREHNGQFLLAILEQIGRGAVLEATALEPGSASGTTTIDLAGEPSRVEVPQATQTGERLQVQVQPRGTRAILQALPAILNNPAEPVQGTIVSIDGPQATVRVQDVNLLGRVATPVAVGETTTVRLVAAGAVRELVIGTPPVVPDSQTSAAARVATSPANDATIRALDLPVTAATRTAVAQLLESGFQPSAAGANPAGPAITPAIVQAAVALESGQVPINRETLGAASALLNARVAVTAESVQAARFLLQLGAPVTPQAVSAAVALLEISITPSPAPTQALANSLFTPSTLSADLVTVLQGLAQLSDVASSGLSRLALADLRTALASIQIELARPDAIGDQVQYATKYGGLHTERFLGALTEHAANPGASMPAPEVTQDAARDLRVLLAEVSRVIERTGADGALPDSVRTSVSEALTRISDRMQGLQLQNLRGPLVEHLTVELPTAAESGVRNVQVQVYYRHGHREGESKRPIDPQNTTVAVLLDTTQLGPVNATLGITNGVLTTDFRVDTPAAAALLMEDVEDLRGALGALGYDVSRVHATARRVGEPTRSAPTPSRIDADGIDVTI